MQYAISDDAAIAFARGFYMALAHGRGIDEAVRSGRIGILGLSRGTLEWITPVLYLRGDDTRLFDVAPLASGSTADAARTSVRRRRASSATGSRQPGISRAGWKPWLIAGVIAVLAIGAGVAALFLLRPWGDVTGGGSEAGGRGGAVTTEVFIPVDRPWTDTELSCDAGDTFNIKASGQAYFWTEELSVGPEGLQTGEFVESRVARSENSLSLIGTLDTVDEPFFVGYAATYVCPVAGRLSLGVNDNSLDGNGGQFWAAITLRPSG